MSKSYTQEQLKDLWDFFDEDKSGTIPVSELKNVFKQLGSCDQTSEMKAKVSSDNLQQNLILYVHIMLNLINWKFSSSSSLQRVMAKCDKNLDDIITFEEFCIGMQQDQWRDMSLFDKTISGMLNIISDICLHLSG